MNEIASNAVRNGNLRLVLAHFLTIIARFSHFFALEDAADGNKTRNLLLLSRHIPIAVFLLLCNI